MIDLNRAFRERTAPPKRIHRKELARRSLCVTAMLAIAMSAPAYANANDVAATAPETAPRNDGTGRWFGWQVALVDLGSIALIAGGGALTATSTGFAVLPIVGGASYFAGGPIVHVLHDDSRGAWRSVLLRVAVPVGSAAAFAGLAALTASRERSDVCFPRSQQACAAVFGAVAGFGVGMVGAMVTDWITAREPAAAPSNEVTWSVTPLVVNGGHGIGVTGVF